MNATEKRAHLAASPDRIPTTDYGHGPQPIKGTVVHAVADWYGKGTVGEIRCRSGIIHIGDTALECPVCEARSEIAAENAKRRRAETQGTDVSGRSHFARLARRR